MLQNRVVQRDSKQSYRILKKDKTPILVGLGEGKESYTPLIEIHTPDLWNTHDKSIEVPTCSEN